MTLNADENKVIIKHPIMIYEHESSERSLDQAREEHEKARQEKAKRINSIFTHVSESREAAREERRNSDPEEILYDTTAETNFILYVMALVAITVLTGLGIVTMVRFFIDLFK